MILLLKSNLRKRGGAVIKVEKIDKAFEKELKETLTPQITSHPLMMFYCPERSIREKFISDYLDYYLYSWTKYGELYLSSDKKVAASLVSIGAFEYKFSGKNAMKIRLNKNSYRIFLHREMVESIAGIVVPEALEARVLTLYGSGERNASNVKELVEELKLHAEERGFVLVYETFSKRMIPFMSELGFEVAYQKQFMDTQFVQTAMTYNIS